MKKSFTEIDESWSERDVNLMLLFLEAQSVANEIDDQKFYARIAELVRAELKET